MLKEININNFAIIKQMNIDFEPGMTIITGQTGAGKSIVIDAIEQLLGSRTIKDKIATNSDFAYIEGVFEYNEVIKEILIANDLYFEDDFLFISKKIKSDGKTQLKINNRLVTNELVKLIGSELIEIHSQNESYELLNQANQQSYLDSFFNEEESNIYQEYIIEYYNYKKLKKEKADLMKDSVDSDLLSFYQEQLKEIDTYLLAEDQVNNLETQENYYKEYEKVNNLLNDTNNLLSDKYLDTLNIVSNNLDSLSNIDEKYQNISTKITDIYFELKDINNNLIDDLKKLFYDEDEYEIIKEKLYNHQRLLKKYSYSYEDIVNKKETLLKNINYILNSDEILHNLDQKITNSSKTLFILTNQINEYRHKYLNEIENKITFFLKQLYLKDAVFKIEIEETDFNNYGNTKINFMFNANKGSQLRLLKNVASGGELSRLMLALKVLKIKSDKTYIFDEVDIGVSGEVADAIGKLLKQLSNNNNVIAITHLAQVARYSDHHLFIEKSIDDDYTTSNAYYLDDEEKVNKLALMLSGDKVSNLALQHAKELLNYE